MDFGIMKFIGNILWMVLGGFIISLIYVLVGIIFCISICIIIRNKVSINIIYDWCNPNCINTQII